MSLTLERLRELLEYSPETGVFVWKIKRKKVNPGDIAGTIKSNGYRNITINRHEYGAHRLAWLYVHGKFPARYIDHINRNKQDNRLVNLREATPQQNTHNRRGDKNSKTGIKGVYFKPKNARRCFESWIMCSGKQHYLGRFKTAEEASVAYQAAATTLHGKFAGGLP